MPATGRKSTPVQCPVCPKIISRKADLPRHMRTHAENKEELMHRCPYAGCDYKTLQKSNLNTHIRTHTREFTEICLECPFAATDPGSLTRHRKYEHGHKPKPRRNYNTKAARRSAIAPYPSTRYVTPEVEIPASLDLNDLTFPEHAGITGTSCGSPSPSKSSNSQLSGEFTELSLERLFLDLPADGFTSICGEPSQLPIHTPNHLQPPTVPVDLSTFHIDPQLLSDAAHPQVVHEAAFQFESKPISNEDFQYQPLSGTDVNSKLSAELEEFLKNYGSGFFEGRCEFPENAPYSMACPSSTNEYNA